MIGSLGAILDYLEITKTGSNLSLKRPYIEKKKSVLEIDENTRRNLEINKSIMGEKKSSLIGILNKTSTNFGFRPFFDTQGNYFTFFCESVFK